MLLALDTSGRVSRAAVCAADGAVLRSAAASEELRSEQVLALIHDVTGGRPESIDKIAVCAGPGSFTGLRIGLSIALGLGAATGAEVIAVPLLSVGAECDRLAGGSAAMPIAVYASAHSTEMWVEIFHNPLSSLLGEGCRSLPLSSFADGAVDGAPVRPVNLDLVCPAEERAGAIARTALRMRELNERIAVAAIYGKAVNAKTIEQRREASAQT